MGELEKRTFNQIFNVYEDDSLDGEERAECILDILEHYSWYRDTMGVE